MKRWIKRKLTRLKKSEIKAIILLYLALNLLMNMEIAFHFVFLAYIIYKTNRLR